MFRGVAENRKYWKELTNDIYFAAEAEKSLM